MVINQLNVAGVPVLEAKRPESPLPNNPAPTH
jgi:hypothetical protein